MTPAAQMLTVVMAGGALGAAARYLIGGWLLRALGSGFPWGTLAVNLLGSLLAGVLLAYLQDRGAAAALWRGFLLVGVLGALTTWSTLIVELHLMQRADASLQAVGYLALSLVGSIALLLAGLRIGDAAR